MISGEPKTVLSRRVGSLCLILAASSSALATTIDPMTWEELVVRADLVRIVECVVAGGIVADYWTSHGQRA